MKKYSLLLLLLIPSQIFSQDYKLFTATSKKLFTDYPVPNNTYSLSIESAMQIGTDSVYINFFALEEDGFESDSCDFWGGPECNKQKAPVWAGSRIEFDNVFKYRFYNLNNDSLYFFFTSAINGPVDFYEDSSQRFSIVFDKFDTLTVLNQPDSAVYFQIAHTDLAGNPINSALNGEHIIIAKAFGLVRFFVIDSFPSVLKPIALIGNVNPTAGLYQLTNEMVYDYQPGDEIQYKESSWYQPPAPPWYYYTRYRKYIFLEREQTDEYLNYTIRQELFYKDSVGIEIDTIHKQYLRSEIIAQIPFEKFDGSTNCLQMVDYCEEPKWTYSINTIMGAEFCEEDTCWGGGDTQGPPDEYNTSYVLGLGLYSKSVYNGFEYGFNIQKTMVYFKEGEVECGNEVLVSNDEFNVPSAEIVLSPNPATKAVRITSSVQMLQIVLSDVYGNTTLQHAVHSSEFTIDTGPYSDGLYFVSILLDNGEVATKKLVVLKKF
jgi:hypothetical protein